MADQGYKPYFDLTDRVRNEWRELVKQHECEQLTDVVYDLYYRPSVPGMSGDVKVSNTLPGEDWKLSPVEHPKTYWSDMYFDVVVGARIMHLPIFEIE